ncbi:MAG: ribonuclease III [Clostridia bacterium]|nr:ribonuclease III [Clostridia bacterium]
MGLLSVYDCNPRELSPLTLAFVGDGVFDLIVREDIVCDANRPVKELNKLKVERVRCEAQAELMRSIEPLLTEEEADVYRRGRNAHTSHTPKNASNADYHTATGLEALFGYLYLSGSIERIRELLKS